MSLALSKMIKLWTNALYVKLLNQQLRRERWRRKRLWPPNKGNKNLLKSKGRGKQLLPTVSGRPLRPRKQLRQRSKDSGRKKLP